MARGELQRMVGTNLRSWRQARGLSQEAFADVLGVHRIAEELGVEARELLEPQGVGKVGGWLSDL